MFKSDVQKDYEIIRDPTYLKSWNITPSNITGSDIHITVSKSINPKTTHFFKLSAGATEKWWRRDEAQFVIYCQVDVNHNNEVGG